MQDCDLPKTNQICPNLNKLAPKKFITKGCGQVQRHCTTLGDTRHARSPFGH